MGAIDASAPWLRGADAAPTAPLVGRARERRLLAGLIDAADGGGAAAVVLGEAGMGKTSLLEFVGMHASRQGAAVVALRGVEPEAVLPFAAIADLLLPLREHMGRLPATQRQALEVCLALPLSPDSYASWGEVILCSPISALGDSGSAVLRDDNPSACIGHVVGGLEGYLTVVQHLQYQLDNARVRLRL
ncbi:MAG TPA: ATP-binding protein [Actinomycetes bacterium]